MKKSMILAAVAALVLCACAKVETVKPVVDEPVSFGVYVPKTTKAGTPGTITTNGAESTVSLQTEGFGVFATYSDGGDYAATIGPNFMYNTKVSTAAWTYSPVKYWPNETINDNNGASGPANADKLSFLAYAPWVNHKEAYGSTGITGLNHSLEDYYHTRRDTYDNMNEQGLADCYAVTVMVLEKFDEGAKQ